MSSKNERKKGLGRGLSSFIDVNGFDDIVEGNKEKIREKKTPNYSSYLPIEHLVPNQKQPRKYFSKDEKLYSWWSYRNRDWKKSNRGRRLDHIMVSKDLDSTLKSFLSCKEIRDWEKPSDHVPLILELSI